MGTKPFSFLSFHLIISLCIQLQLCTSADTLNQSQNISVGETLVSAGKIFELGFFSPGNSSNQYVGIWYKKIPVRRALWVANRETPIKGTDPASSLTIGDDGNLWLLDGNGNIVWSTNISVSTNHSVAVLLDNGNFILQNSVSGESIWESFHHPCDSAVPGMMIGLNSRTHQKQFLTSWKTENNPSAGDFSFSFTAESAPQAFTWNKSQPIFRTGQWDGQTFTGFYQAGFSFVTRLDEDNHYIGFKLFNSSNVFIFSLSPTGAFNYVSWDEGTKEWIIVGTSFESQCDVYGQCGAFGFCNRKALPICRCLNGFVPKSEKEWSKGIWTNGCVRRSELNCHNNTSNFSSGSKKIDGFQKFGGVKLPDLSTHILQDDAQQCKNLCLKNCTCKAYTFITGIGCLLWTEDLLDIQEFSNGGRDLFVRLANSELGKGKDKKKMIITVAVSSSLILLGVILYLLHRMRAKRREKMAKSRQGFLLPTALNTIRAIRRVSLRTRHAKLTYEDSAEFPEFDYETIVAATNNFCSENILGKGGFGPVYKGKMEDGREIAVKKLSTGSGQGMDEFKNEILLISKLQHRNLVRLFGFCIEGEELMIVYEYLPNRSLDFFLFDPVRRLQLDWASRFNIIQGIARGLLYLHRDSCLKIIHRDLKVSNILLDKDMNPKISDFGLARVFQGTEEMANTQRVIGTYGYMSPEYALGGIFSEKSDMFSFGVLLLEIVSGRRSASFHLHESDLSLVGYAWQQWTDNKALEFMDESLADSCIPTEVTRCIQIGLICVQDQAADRPTMPSIVRMLSGDAEPPRPKQPTFTFRSLGPDMQSQSSKMDSSNDITITKMEGR